MQLAPNREQLWQTLRLLIAGALAEGIGLALGLYETYWALITTLVVTNPMQSDARAKGFDRTFASIIGGIVGLGVLELERFNWPKLPLFAPLSCRSPSSRPFAQTCVLLRSRLSWSCWCRARRTHLCDPSIACSLHRLASGLVSLAAVGFGQVEAGGARLSRA